MADPAGQTTIPAPHPSPTDWLARHAEIVAADGDDDAWERLNDAYARDWLAAYRTAFVATALARGWPKADAESWLDPLADEALIAYHGGNPTDAAVADVQECEDAADD